MKSKLWAERDSFERLRILSPQKLLSLANFFMHRGGKKEEENVPDTEEKTTPKILDDHPQLVRGQVRE
jgi:hypothetical protein